MSLIYHDGFDRSHQNTGETNNTGTTYVRRQGWPGFGAFGNGVIFRDGRRAGGGAFGQHFAMTFTYRLGVMSGSPALTGDRTSRKRVLVGGAWKLNDLSRDHRLFLIGDDDYGIKVEVSWRTATRALDVKDATGTVVATTTAGSWNSLDDWHFLEVDATRNATTGVIKVWVDDTLVVNLTGQNTGDAAYGYSALDIGQGDACLDDLYILDPTDGTFPTARLGSNVASLGIAPSADVSVAFTPDSGSNNWSRLAPDMDDDATYNQTATQDSIDLFTFPTPAVGIDSVIAVTLMPQSRRPSGGTARITGQVKIGATTYSEPVNNGTPDTEYDIKRWKQTTSPATAANWTVSEVFGAAWGYKSTEQTDPLRVTSDNLEVLVMLSPPAPPPATVNYRPTAQADALVAINSLLDVRATAEAGVAFSIAAPVYYRSTALLDAWSTETIPTSAPPDFSYTATGEAFVRYVGEAPEVSFYVATAEADATFDVDGVGRYQAVAVASAKFRRLADGRIDLLLQDVYPR